MKTVEIFTDGACSGNPGPGGWAAILKCNGGSKELSGSAKDTTNNRMELMGPIEGLSALKEICDTTIYSDSKYVVDAINLGWAHKWQSNNWRKADGKEAKNIDLWNKLLTLVNIHNPKFVWVKGHSGHPENERCDTLAVMQVNKNK